MKLGMVVAHAALVTSALAALAAAAGCHTLKEDVSFLRSPQDPPYDVHAVLKYHAQKYDLPGLFDLEVEPDGHVLRLSGELENRAELVLAREVVRSLYPDPETIINIDQVHFTRRKNRDLSLNSYYSAFYGTKESDVIDKIVNFLASDPQFRGQPIYAHFMDGEAVLVGAVPIRTLDEARARYLDGIKAVERARVVPVAN
ncbi:MAG: hypothetical protein HY719_03160 [Planctomycetes bacterium]|nr:hypothetical protein [Planctomycetota bacterium]